MSDEHHLVRNFVVRGLPRLGRPISVAEISRALGLTRTRTASIVDDLEKHLFFLVRGDGAEVSWAFPVTAEKTGHHLVFSTGERLDAA
jgi:ribosomal protein L30/L7E